MKKVNNIWQLNYSIYIIGDRTLVKMTRLLHLCINCDYFDNLSTFSLFCLVREKLLSNPRNVFLMYLCHIEKIFPFSFLRVMTISHAISTSDKN